MKIRFEKEYQDIVSLENLFSAWQELIAGKRQKRDVQQFSLRLTDNLVQLHSDLSNFTYEHGAMRPSISLIPSRVTFIKRPSGTGFCTMGFTDSSIRFLTGHS